MRIRNAILPFFACIALAPGCANTTRSVGLAPEQVHATLAEAPLRAVARLHAWSGIPDGLERHVTPLLITIINDGEAPIRVTLDAFVLLSGDFERYDALRPAEIQGHLDITIDGAPYAISGFEYADAGASARSGRPVEGYWSRYSSHVRTIKLPTYDMKRKALPEGVLQPGGRVSGFIYFEPVRPDARDVRLRARLAPPSDQHPSTGWFDIKILR